MFWLRIATFAGTSEHRLYNVESNLTGGDTFGHVASGSLKPLDYRDGRFEVG